MNLPPNPIIYEVYPRSFRDSSGTGEGDLQGVHERIDYIASLNVDAIWLAPFFPSPMIDGGYDVSDYCDVDPRYGDLATFEKLVDAAHQRGLAVIVDLVFNHTSDQHGWFAKSARCEPGYENRYIWADPKPDGSEPNNWRSFFGGTAWRWNPIRNQYHLHQYHESQPSLNLRCPELRRSLGEVVRFWRERGVDGFRFDAVTAYLSDPDLRDNPVADSSTQCVSAASQRNPYSYQRHAYDMLGEDGAQFMETVREWCNGAYMLGEIGLGDQSMVLANMFTKDGRLNSAYTTDLMDEPPTCERVLDLIERQSDSGCITWLLGCHDQPRLMSRAAGGDTSEAKFLAMLLAVLPGPIIQYQGDELGLTQPHLEREQMDDPFDRMFYPHHPGRSGARIPLPWTADAPNFGFSQADPWLPMHHAATLSVASQNGDPESLLNFYRSLNALRRSWRAQLRDACYGLAAPGVLSIEISGSMSALLNFNDEVPFEPSQYKAAPALSSSRWNGRLNVRSAAIWTHSAV